MKQTPCEYVVWRGLPALRREIAISMIKNFGLSQREAAQRLNITPAAVSQYLSRKRGDIDIDDIEILNEISVSAKKIIQDGDDVIVSEICRLCKIFSSKEIFQFICNSCKDEIFIKK